MRWWARRHGLGDVPTEELIRAKTIILRVDTKDIEDLETDPWGPEEQFEGDYYRTDVQISPDKIEILGDDGEWRTL